MLSSEIQQTSNKAPYNGQSISLIDNGTDINDHLGFTPLQYAVVYANRGQEDTAINQLLLDRGTDSSFKDFHSHKTPLHYVAMTYNFVATAQNLLITYTSFYWKWELIVTNHLTIRQRTPFHEALAILSLKFIKLLLEYMGNIRAVSREGGTAINFAVRDRNIDVIEFVLEQGFDIQC